jgi:asparagine synthase (glutamine-hydrolysing)
MPGIAGIISRRPADECRPLVSAMVRSLCHEPFYESATCCMPEIGLYAGWAAHQGSFAARQNAGTEAADIRLVLAGECFGTGDGHDALDGDCAGEGGARTPGLAKPYETAGDRFVAGLNGLFSGLLIDRRRSRALLFNDRYGAERIYVHEASEDIYFASEAKALLAVVPELRAFDDEGVAHFLTYGCTLDWRTIFRGVRLLEGGSLWCLQEGELRQTRYFVPEQWEREPALTAGAFEAEFKETFRRILPRYVGQGDTGISLTGGLDTRMILACLPAVPRAPVCYTFSGLTEDTLDQRLAARAAAACQLQHHVLRIGPDFLSQYGRHVDRTVYVTDGSCGATGAHEVYLNARARQLAAVRLTGNFGSEVLRSMSTFKPIHLSADLLDRDFRPFLASAGRRPPRNEHPVTFSAFREIPWNLFGTMAAGKSQVTFRTPYLDNEIVSLAFRAPAISRRSSEVALRFISDNHAALGRIPTDRGFVADAAGPAHAMRRLFSEVTFKLDYLYQEGLPHRLSPLDSLGGGLSRLGLLGLHKYLPFRHWFRRDLARYVADVLTDPRTSRLPYWNAAFLGPMARDHIGGRRNYVREINAVLTLEAVDRLLVSGDANRVPCQHR